MLVAGCLPLSAQTSPGGKIQVVAEGDTLLRVSTTAPDGSAAGVMDLCCGKIVKTIDAGRHNAEYEMLTGKRRLCSNAYEEKKYVLAGGDTLSVRVWNDGVTWGGMHSSKIRIPNATHNWLADWTDSYESFFPRDRRVKPGDRFCYPALFEYAGKEGSQTFMLLTESNIDRDNAGSSLHASSAAGEYLIQPDGPEMPGWQTAIIGSLADVAQSTLVADNSAPCRLNDTGWVEPGVASWVYWAYNHGSEDYLIVSRYIDMAAELRLPYVLIDADWDKMGEGKNVLDAVAYARSKGVKPMIWYNSSVGWIDGAPGPKFRLNKPEDREKEFAWCEENGIAGVKIDFFSGDTNLNIRYMIELLESAARHRLLVNFHGATIPRGWQRTYPNLVSTEGVYGAEWYNNVPTFTDKAACHNATLPFTRNVVGPMDYTPCAFTDSQHPHITTHAHELALTVLYESGIQHLADRPESFLAQPAKIREFLTELPAAWDDTRLLGGYPGEYAVMARRKGNEWWIAGINGGDAPLTITPDYSPTGIAADAKALYIGDTAPGGDEKWDIRTLSSLPEKITMEPRGGFLLRIAR